MGYKINKIYVGNQLVWPKKEPRILLDETNFKQSSYSKNGYFQPVGWGSASSFSNTAYDTANGRIYSSGSHSYGCIKFTNSAYSVIGNAKKLKIVYDYLYIPNNANTYASGIRLPWALLAKKSSGWLYEDYINLNYSPIYYSAINWAVEYSGELIYDFESDTGTMTFTNLSDNTESVSTLSGLKQYRTTNALFLNSSTGIYTFAGQYRDQGSAAYCGEVHVYYQL